MLESPAYQRRRAVHAAREDADEAKLWAIEYLNEDVARLQFLKQHHYHPVNAESGERVPLHGCQKGDKEGMCKSDFPRNAWQTDRGMVLCPCQAEAHGKARTQESDRGVAWPVWE